MSAVRCLTRASDAKVIFYAAISIAVASQVSIALTLGDLPGSHRSSWIVTAFLFISLTLPTATVIFSVWRMPSEAFTNVALATIAIAGLIMRLPYFGVGPMLEDDHFRYMLDGAMTAHGFSPYGFSPAELGAGRSPAAQQALAAAGHEVVEKVNFPELRTMYPGTAQAAFALGHIMMPWSVDGLRIVMLLCEIATALLMWALLGRLELPRHLLAAVWCNPLMAFSLTGQAHIDAALVPALLVTVLASLQRAGVLAGVSLGVAIGVKLWPVLLVPLVARFLWGDRKRVLIFLVATGAVTLMVCAPLVLASARSQSGLVAYASGWQINNFPYAWASYIGYIVAGGAGLEPVLRGGVVLGSLGLSLAIAKRDITEFSDFLSRLTVLAGAVFYLSPAQFPWYASWFLALAVLDRNWALVAATASLPVYFLFFPLAGGVWGDLHRYWLSGLHLLPVIAIVLVNRAATPPSGCR